MIIDALVLAARANLALSTAIVAVAVLRWPVRTIFGASASYLLWAIPGVMALASLMPAPQGGPVAPVILVATRGLSAALSASSGPGWPAMVITVWTLGALVFAAQLWVQQRRFTSALRGASRSSIGGRPVVRAAGTDIGPAVVGRAIILPMDFEARFTAAEQAAIMAHEARHLARGDVAANAVVAAVQCLCWFNPLIHLAARWIRSDQELACDAAVIGERPEMRRPYAEALLKTQTLAAIPPVGCAWRARGFSALRGRIRLLKQRAPGRARRALAGLLIAGLTVGGGYGAWAIQPAQGNIITAPAWSRMPGGADLVRLYPHKALTQEMEGLAVMQCRVSRSGGLLGCAIVHEAPLGAGFGEATLKMAPLFKMKPMSVDGKPVAGGIVRIPVKFDLSAGGAGQP